MSQDSLVELNEAVRLIEGMLVKDLPALKDTLDPLECPVCHQDLVSFSWTSDADYDRLEKMGKMTVAQLASLLRLQRRSGMSVNQILDKTTDYGDYLGVSDFHGMFIGIEKDGYAHS